MKLVLLYSLVTGAVSAAPELVSSDRFLLKILDHTVSYQDIVYQHRNIKGLQCVFSDDSIVIQYFKPSFIKDLGKFLEDFPKDDEGVRKHMHVQRGTDFIKKLRLLFKILRYSEDQKIQVSPELSRLVRESTEVNKCGSDILYKDTLKTNFIELIQVELYFRSRYGGQLKAANKNFEVVRPSIDLFVESLDKQFNHEYYW